MAKIKNTPMQEAFLEALFDSECKGDLRKAMKKAGYSANTPTSDVVPFLKDQIIDRTKDYLAMNAGKAAVGLVEMIENPTALGSKTKLAAVNELLDRIGVVKQDNSLSNLPKGAIIYLPPKEQPMVIEGQFKVIEKIEKGA
jgi:hypothetical protein